MRKPDITRGELQHEFDKLWAERRALDELHMDVIKHELMSDSLDQQAYAAISGELATLSMRLESRRMELVNVFTGQRTSL
jgi:hypothetical protein